MRVVRLVLVLAMLGAGVGMLLYGRADIAENGIEWYACTSDTGGSATCSDSIGLLLVIFGALAVIAALVLLTILLVRWRRYRSRTVEVSPGLVMTIAGDDAFD